MQPSNNPNQVDPNATSSATPEIPQHDEYSQYFQTMQVSIASGETPGNIQPVKPEGSLWLKILTAYFWAALGLSVLGTIIIVMISVSDPLAGAGAGWGLLLTVPGIFINAVSLMIIYLVRWLATRSNAKRASAQTITATTVNPNEAEGLVRFAILFGVIVILYTLYQAARSVMVGLGYGDFGDFMSEGIIPVAINLLLGAVSLVGLVLLAMNNSLKGKRKQLVVLLFLSPLITGIILGGINAVFFMSGSGATRTQNQIERLSFKPILPPRDFVDDPNTRLKYVLVHDDRFDIDFGKVSEDHAETYLSMSQVSVDKQDKLQGSAVTCKGSKYQFKTARGTEVTAIIYEDGLGVKHGQFCFTRDGVRISLRLPNDVVLKDEKAVGVFIDSLQQINPEDISAYYTK